MKYIAVNAKIKAMTRQARSGYREHMHGAKHSLEAGNSLELEKICHYLPKNARDFLRKFAADFRFYENLRHLATLDKLSRDSLRRVFLVETNLRNILKIYRLKRFYNLHGDAVLPYLTPVGNTAEISRLTQTKSLDEFLREAANGTGAAFENDFASGEKMLARAVCAAFRKEYRHENLSVAAGFLYEGWVNANGCENEIHQHNGAYREHEPRD